MASYKTRITCNISSQVPIPSETLTPGYGRFIWNKDSANLFRNALLSHPVVELHTRLLTDNYETSRSDKNIIQDFNTLIRMAANNSLFFKGRKSKLKSRKRKSRSHLWFDKRCTITRADKAKRNYQRNPYLRAARSKYVQNL